MDTTEINGGIWRQWREDTEVKLSYGSLKTSSVKTYLRYYLCRITFLALTGRRWAGAEVFCSLLKGIFSPSIFGCLTRFLDFIVQKIPILQRNKTPVYWEQSAEDCHIQMLKAT